MIPATPDASRDGIAEDPAGGPASLESPARGDAVDPEASESDTAESDAEEPDAAECDTPDSGDAESDAAEWDAAESDATGVMSGRVLLPPTEASLTASLIRAPCSALTV